MRSNFVKSLTLSGVAVSLAFMTAVGCASKKTVENQEPPAAVSGAGTEAPTPDVTPSKSIATDPKGSDSGNIPGLNTVYFEYDQARLTSDTRKKLSENANWIKNNPNFTVQVEGHTDSRGSVEYNLALGERRAKSVKTYLESQGIEGRRITIISYGKEKPIDSGEGESAWAKNRRANFVPIQ